MRLQTLARIVVYLDWRGFGPILVETCFERDKVTLVSIYITLPIEKFTPVLLIVYKTNV